MGVPWRDARSTKLPWRRIASVRQAWLLVLDTRGTPRHGTSIGLMSSILSINAFAMFQPVFAQRFYYYRWPS
jgi:hypothetical protein